MSMSTCRKAITDVLKTYSGTPKILAENIATQKGDEDGEYARWSIRPATTVSADAGATFERIVGTLYFQHFIPEGSGTKAAHDFTTKIGALFNEKRVASGGGSGQPTGVVIFRRATCKYSGKISGIVQHNITVDFQEDATAVNAS